jgi:hypothetical protein
VRFLIRKDANNSPASAFDTGAPAARFVLPGSAGLSSGIAGFIASLVDTEFQNPKRSAPPPQADELCEFYRDDRTQKRVIQSRR